MFRLSVVDHVRLNFGHAVQNYTVHARAAERLAALAWKVRIGVLTLFGASLALAVAAAMTAGAAGGSRWLQIAAAGAAGLAFAAHAACITLGVEGRVQAHRTCAQRLWLVCERYRALLAEIQDELLDTPTLLRRRDELITELHATYEQPFPADHPAFESLRQAPQRADRGGLTDSEIDQHLPPSLRLADDAPEPAHVTKT
jgi:hypothetical protein